jgi:hypothetical protein
MYSAHHHRAWSANPAGYAQWRDILRYGYANTAYCHTDHIRGYRTWRTAGSPVSAVSDPELDEKTKRLNSQKRTSSTERNLRSQSGSAS